MQIRTEYKPEWIREDFVDFIVLDEKVEEGYLLTPVIETDKFTEITPSWNSRTSSHSSVELFIKIRSVVHFED